jgi:tRNA(Leu) C34 or U34 (ribose-2'-O)-methylase TrmL
MELQAIEFDTAIGPGGRALLKGLAYALPLEWSRWEAFEMEEATHILKTARNERNLAAILQADAALLSMREEPPAPDGTRQHADRPSVQVMVNMEGSTDDIREATSAYVSIMSEEAAKAIREADHPYHHYWTILFGPDSDGLDFDIGQRASSLHSHIVRNAGSDGTASVRIAEHANIAAFLSRSTNEQWPGLKRAVIDATLHPERWRENEIRNGIQDGSIRRHP